MSIKSAVSGAVGAVVNKAASVFVSTAFRHRLTAVCVPVAVFAIDKVVEQVVGTGATTTDGVVATTVALAVLGWLRGKVSPA